MTTRHLAFAWVLAVLLAAAVAVVLASLGRATPASIPGDAAAPVVVIGSSLMRYAVPPTLPGSGGLLKDGRAHLRVGVSSVTERQVVELLAQALDAGARTVLVEINPLAFDFAYKTRLGSGFSRVLQLFSSETMIGLKHLLGRPLPIQDAAGEPPDMETSVTPTQESLERHYPLRLRQPEDRSALDATLARARALGVEIVLIKPPRARAASDYLGAKAVAALDAHLVGLARDLGLPLFSTADSWPDDHFIDNAHMNRTGRARFVVELANWWCQRP